MSIFVLVILIYRTMLTSEQVSDTLKLMPENFSIDRLFDQLIFVNKVETGLSQSANGQVNTKEQAKEKLFCITPQNY